MSRRHPTRGRAGPARRGPGRSRGRRRRPPRGRSRRRPGGGAAGPAPGCRPPRPCGWSSGSGRRGRPAGAGSRRAARGRRSRPRRRPARGSRASPWSPTGCRGAGCRSRRTGWSAAARPAPGRRRRCRCPGRTGPGRTRPVWVSACSSGSLAGAPTGPVQLTTPATVSSVPSLRVTVDAVVGRGRRR